jgi:hypothetical protein
LCSRAAAGKVLTLPALGDFCELINSKINFRVSWIHDREFDVQLLPVQLHHRYGGEKLISVQFGTSSDGLTLLATSSKGTANR